MPSPEQISQLATARNGMSAKEVFIARSAYRLALIGSGVAKNLYSMWGYGGYYGFVNTQFDAININGRTSSLLDNGTLIELGVPRSLQFGVNFVVDAFREFSTFYNVLRDAGKISSSPSKLVNISPTKGIVSTIREHENHVEKIYKLFVSHIFSTYQLKKIITFEDFMGEITKFLFDTVSEMPITRSGFTKSIFIDPHCSGLIISIDQMDHDKDINKIEKYYKNENFDTYKEVANRFGFAIDGNAPWRLIAKVTSPRMHTYMEKHGWFPHIFKSGLYARTSPMDMGLLKRHLTSMYNAIAQTNRRAIDSSLNTQCIGLNPLAPGKLNIVDNVRRSVTLTQAEEKFNNFYWAKLCFKLRLIEEGLQFSEDYVSQVAREAFAIGQGGQNTVDFSKVMMYLDVQVKQRRFATQGQR